MPIATDSNVVAVDSALQEQVRVLSQVLHTVKSSFLGEHAGFCAVQYPRNLFLSLFWPKAIVCYVQSPRDGSSRNPMTDGCSNFCARVKGVCFL